MMEFFAMGGYAFYVWTSYGIAFTVLLVNIFAARAKSRAIHEKLRRKAAMNDLENSATTSESSNYET